MLGFQPNEVVEAPAAACTEHQEVRLHDYSNKMGIRGQQYQQQPMLLSLYYVLYSCFAANSVSTGDERMTELTPFESRHMRCDFLAFAHESSAKAQGTTVINRQHEVELAYNNPLSLLPFKFDFSKTGIKPTTHRFQSRKYGNAPAFLP